MSFEFRFRIEAESDLAGIRDCYNRISDTITNNFFKEFFEALNLIEREPQLFQIRYRGIRITPLY